MAKIKRGKKKAVAAATKKGAAAAKKVAATKKTAKEAGGERGKASQLLKERVYKLLESAKKHITAEAIADKLGVTAAAVRNRINKLRDEGHDIEGVRKQGYILN